MHVVEDFEAMAVGQAGGGDAPGLRLVPSCHPDATTTALYNLQAGTLSIRCAVCGMGVVDVAVAKRRSWAQRRRRAPASAETPKLVQRMDEKARKNRSRRK